jgi:hypothetical protein
MRARLLSLLAVALAAPAWALEPNLISTVEVKDAGSEVVLTVLGSRKPSFTTFSMADPPRFVIDFSESKFQGVPDEVPGAGGVVQLVKNLSYGSGSTAIARVMIAFSVEVDPPSVEDSGNGLVVRITKPGGAPAVAAAPDADAKAKAKADADAAAKADADAKVKADTDARAKADADAKAKVDADAKAKADADARAKADADAQAKADADAKARADADAKAKADADAQPKAAAAAPAADDADQKALEDEIAAAKSGKDSKAEAKAAKQAAKEAARAAKARELEEKKAARLRAQEEAKERARQAREAKLQAKEEAQRAREEAKAAKAREREEAKVARQRAKEEAAAAKAAKAQARAEPAEATKPGPATGDDQGDLDAEIAAAREQARKDAREVEGLSPDAPLARIREVGFKQLPGVSRVFVRTSAAVQYTVQDLDDRTVRIELENTRVLRYNDLRFLDTSFFPSAVQMITPSRQGTSYVITVKLRERVPYEQKRVGDMLAVDFQRPATAAGTPAKPPPAGAAEPGASEPME